MARLKVFVVDQLATGASPARPPPRSLRRQGEMLLQALLADLGALPDIELVTTAHLDAMPNPAADTAVVTAGAGVGGMNGINDIGDIGDMGGMDGAAGGVADAAVWPLACESEGTLARLSHAILRGRRILLGSAPGAVEVAASKFQLARVLAEGGVAAVATYSPHAALPQDGGPWVVKPDDGAGCLDTRLFSDRAAALAWIRASAADGHALRSYVLQPFVAGRLGSLSLICCDGAARVLACNQERVAMRDNRFHYLGSVVNGLADHDGALARLARQVAAAMPSLWGYVGVDFVLSAQGAVVLDVNPRLTAAYVGLHASTGCNPAGLVLDLLRGPAAAMDAPAGMRRAVSVDVGAP